MTFNQVLATSWFRYGVLPGIATGVAFLIKFNSRPDAKPSELEDWAVGFDLCQVSIFSLLGDGVTDAVSLISKTMTDESLLKERLTELPWILFGMLVVLFLVSFIVRKAGWTNPATGPQLPSGCPPAQPKLNGFGLALPLIIGAGYLISAIMWMGGSHG